MEPSTVENLRGFLKEALERRGDHGEFGNTDPLFSNGRLDSFTMMNLVMYLETTWNVDFSKLEFDIDLVDSVSACEHLIDAKSV